MALPVLLLVLTGGRVSASDYDWRDPGKAETDAVLASLGQPGTEALDKLLDDGLGVDSLLPVKEDLVPLLSLSLGAGRTDVAERLLGEGADADLMSSREIDRIQEDRYHGNYYKRGVKDLQPRWVRDVPKTVTTAVEYAAPLVYAVASSSPGGMKLLIEAGADVDRGIDGGLTPLMFAVALKKRIMMNMLLGAGAAVDSQADLISDIYLAGVGDDAMEEIRDGFPRQPFEGASALWLAARKGRIEYVKTLLQAGARDNQEATCGPLRKEGSGDDTCTALEIAELYHNAGVAALLENPSPAEGGAPAGKPANLKLLLQGTSAGKAE